MRPGRGRGAVSSDERYERTVKEGGEQGASEEAGECARKRGFGVARAEADADACADQGLKAALEKECGAECGGDNKKHEIKGIARAPQTKAAWRRG